MLLLKLQGKGATHALSEELLLHFETTRRQELQIEEEAEKEEIRNELPRPGRPGMKYPQLTFLTLPERMQRVHTCIRT
jgi:hypothetical protein